MENDKQIPEAQGNNKEYEVGYGKPPKESQWQPGQSGNPAGRPLGTRYISEILREKLLEETAEGKTNAELIAEALIGLSKDPKMRGFVPAIKELLDRTEGKVPDTHKIEGDVPVSIVYKLVENKDAQGTG